MIRFMLVRYLKANLGTFRDIDKAIFCYLQHLIAKASNANLLRRHNLIYVLIAIVPSFNGTYFNCHHAKLLRHILKKDNV